MQHTLIMIPHIYTPANQRGEDITQTINPLTLHHYSEKLTNLHIIIVRNKEINSLTHHYSEK